MAYLWFCIVCLIWGSSFILMKKAAGVFGPLTIGAGRLWGGVIVLSLLLALSTRWRPPSGSRLSWRGLGALSVVALLGGLYPFSMQPYLIGKLGQSGFIGMMVSLVPLFTIASAAVMLKTWPSHRQWVGVLAGLACMPVLFGVGMDLGLSTRDMVLAATVPLGYAVSNTWVKRRLSNWSAVLLTGSSCAMAGVVLLPTAAVYEPVQWTNDAAGWTAVGAVALLGVVGTGVATVLFYRLVQQRGPLFAGMVTYVVPVEALLLGAADGETVTRGQVVALLIILLSVAMVQWPSRNATNVGKTLPG